MGRHGSVDVSGIENLKADLERIQKETPAVIKSCANELAARLLRKVIKRTPVGRKPEFKGEAYIKVKGKSGKSKTFMTKAKADHEAMINKYWSGYTGGYLRQNWRAEPVENTGNTYSVKVENPVKYASYVEHGHRQTPGRYVPALGKTLKVSWVKGRHMLSDSVDEIDNIKHNLVRDRVEAFLEERLNGK